MLLNKLYTCIKNYWFLATTVFPRKDVTATIYFSSTAMRRGDYSRAATIRSADVAATIYFSSTAMRRLFEGGYYSKCRCLSQLLFISALPQCGDYSRAATIRSAVSRLLFISALPQCGDYSRTATIRSADVAATIYFSSTTMRRLFEGGYYSKCRCRGYYLFQLYHNVATIRGRLLFEVRRLFEEIRYLLRLKEKVSLCLSKFAITRPKETWNITRLPHNPYFLE